MNTAYVFGILYFISGFLEVFVDLLAFKDNWLFKVIYVFSKAFSFISLFFFFRGFVILSGIFKNYLLQISAFLIVSLTLFLNVLDVLFLFIWDDSTGFLSLTSSLVRSEYTEVLGYVKLITFSILSVLFGVALLRLKELENLSKWTGIIEIVTGVCLLMIFLAPIALVTQAVVEILEIILIYKVANNLKK